jgi:hypothetical protein
MCEVLDEDVSQRGSLDRGEGVTVRARRLGARSWRRIGLAATATLLIVALSLVVFINRHQSTHAVATEGSAPTIPSTTTTAAATTTSTPPNGVSDTTIAQDLVFTGRYQGHVTSAKAASSGEVVDPHTGPDPSLPDACTTSLGGSSADGATIGIVGTLAGQRLLFSWSIGNVNDPTHGLDQPVMKVGTDLLRFDSTKVVVDRDRDGASIDSDLFTADAAGKVVGHVTGHFRCAP